MKMRDFKKMKVINDTDGLKLDDKFLMGEKVIGQMGNKKIGDVITYYKVTLKNENNIAYSPCYETLEEEK
jgi:hypothetical protein